MRTLVLHPVRSKATGRAPEDALAEAVSLAEALDLEVVGAEVVPLPKARAGMLFGKGKIEELGALVAEREAGLVIIDGPLSPVQQRNLEKAWKVKLLDRTGLILEIFGERAQTREGVLQVELAHLSYQKSRLVRSWTHLERQRGGFGFLGGPGETQIEADRRALDERIQRIKQSLSKVVRTRGQHRKARQRVPYPVVALVGYTNAGKSTLFNRLTGSGVLARDMLFATLDPTMRAVALPDGRKAILSDTVGFISDLPTQLVAAFRATLEEVLEADLILHVRDISHPETEVQAENVRTILGEMGIGEAEQGRIVEVWNKIDALPPDRAEALRQVAARTPRVAAISALTGEGVPALLELVAADLAEPMREETISLRFDQGRQRAWLFDRKLVRAEHPREDGYDLDVRWTERDRSQYQALG
ncbi:GTPase HflX [Amaricoccus sp.]|uniref:GTPase HflX n=1 Tax=Amaricoccus sp. TaxID=1872485 RepID=UPI002602139D|nr:GTPase HflX [Amaricoccus sp.]HRO09896.1 GTPase HflX [Amaricoccus sp.]